MSERWAYDPKADTVHQPSDGDSAVPNFTNFHLRREQSALADHAWERFDLASCFIHMANAAALQADSSSGP